MVLHHHLGAIRLSLFFFFEVLLNNKGFLDTNRKSFCFMSSFQLFFCADDASQMFGRLEHF